MSVEKQVDKLLRKKPVKKHFNRKYLIGFGAFVVTVLAITLTALPLFDDKSLLSHVQTYLESKADNNPFAASQPLNGSAYNYWYAPQNSMGIKSMKNVNFTFWKSWLKKYFSYKLEARQNNESAWQNANKLLNVSLLFNQTNNTCKVTLTMNTTNAPRSLYYRFTLVANRSVISHVNKSVDYQYTLNLGANATENYSLVYNYSDLAPYIENGKITIKQGIWNNYFYQRIKTNKKIVVGKTFIIDPTFGSVLGTSAGIYSIQNKIVGSKFQMGANSGNVDNITAKVLFYDTFTNKNITALIYDDSFNYVGRSDYKLISGNGWSYYTFTWDFSAPKPSLTGDAYYWLCLWGENANPDGGIVSLTNASQSKNHTTTNYNGAPDPIAWTDNTSGKECQIYASYTESAGDEWQVVNESINGSAYNTTAWKVVNESINGCCYNTTTWTVINESINGSAYNSTSWTVVSESINGTAYNTSALSWQVVNESINGTAYNTTLWSVINESINGSAYNTTAWQVISDTINGTAYNVSEYWQVVNDTINGTAYNTSIPSAFNITLEYPNNESNIYSIQPTVYFNLTHPNGYTMNYSLYIDNTTLIHSGVNVSNGTQVNADHLFYSANSTYNSFYWRVEVSDGHGNWVNNTYNFQAILQGSIVDSGAGFAVGIAMAAAMLGIGFVFIIRKRRREDEF